MHFLIIFPALLVGLAVALPQARGAGVLGFCVGVLFSSLKQDI